MQTLQITLSGPAGVGKSTITRLLFEALSKLGIKAEISSIEMAIDGYMFTNNELYYNAITALQNKTNNAELLIKINTTQTKPL